MRSPRIVHEVTHCTVRFDGTYEARVYTYALPYMVDCTHNYNNYYHHLPASLAF
jgi:hypothetical protein